MEKKLFRNEHDKMIAGVASGLADYMQVEVTIVRLLFVLSAIFLAGGGLIAYVVIWIIVPVKNDPMAKFSKFNEYFKNNPGAQPFGQTNPYTDANAPSSNWSNPVSEGPQKTPFESQADFSKLNKPNDTGRIIGGLFLLVFGSFFLMKEFDIIPDWFRIRNVWPVILIAIGISIIAKSKRKNEWVEWQNQQDAEKEKAETFTPTVDLTKKEEESNSTSTNPQA